VQGAAAVADRLGARLSKFPRLKGGLAYTGLVLAVVVTVVGVLVYPVGLIILVLDLVLGDWLVAHVAFWDELVGFSEGL
jgi:hypothetical protein